MQTLLNRQPSLRNRFTSKNTFSSHSSSSTNFVQTCYFLVALHSQSTKSDLQIIDSGGDHLTGSSNLVSSYIPYLGHQKVKTVDGSISFVVGKGAIFVSKNLTLNSILHVPKLSCNLISISKLTHDLNCVTKFFPTHCKFQELCTRKTIGCAREVDSLYILDEETKDTRCPSQALQR